MRLLSLLLLVLTFRDLNALIAEYEEFDDDSPSNNYTYNYSDVELHKEIHQTFQHYRKCRADNEWSCDRNCRLEFLTETKKCRSPDPDDNCFGIPITYKYSRDFPMQRFPRELAVLSRYPKCWSHLAPLMCATVYRPCSTHFFIEKDNQGKVKNGLIELWQLLSASLCDTVLHACGSVIFAHVLSTYTQCKGPEHTEFAESTDFNRTLYSGSCQLASDQLPVSVGGGRCAWPLVSTQTHVIHQDTAPVVDDCFLPCRSPLVSDSLASRFRYARFIICSIFASSFVIESAYLSRFSNRFSGCPLLYYLFHAMVSISVHFLLWSVSVLDYFFTLSECSVDGVSRRQAITHSAFEWCSLQSLTLLASFIAAFTWLFTVYSYTTCPPLLLDFLTARLKNNNVRSVLFISIYGFSIILATLLNNMRENDGVTGVCYSGLTTWWKHFVSMVPLLCLLIFFLCLRMFVHFKKDELLKVVAKQEAAATSDNAEERNDADKGSVYKALNPGNCDSASNNGQVPCDSVPANFDRSERLQGLSVRELAGVYHNSQRCIAPSHASKLSRWWSLVSLGFATLFLLAAPIIHYRYNGFGSEGREAMSVVDYINCGTAHAITNRSVQWKSGDTWPSPAIAGAPWCSLPLREARARLEGVLIVFILLPATPFLVLFLAFVAGMNGYGGLTEGCRNCDVSKAPLQVREEAENFQLCSIESKKQLKEKLLLRPNCNEEVLFGANGDEENNEGSSSSLVAVANDFSSDVLDETVGEDGSLPKSGSALDGQNVSKEEVSRKDYQKLRWIVNQLRGDLFFQQSMLVNDGAAWNICLHYMRRMEQVLSQLNSHSSAGAAAQGLRSLTEELSQVLPTVSDHAVQLSRWMRSVQDACVKLEHIQGSSFEDPGFHSNFELQDISRQQNLLALNTNILACQGADGSRSASTSSPEKTPQQKADSSVDFIVRGQNQFSQAPKEQQSSPPSETAAVAVPSPQCDSQPGTSQHHQQIVQERPAANSSDNAEARPLPNGVVGDPQQPSPHQVQRVPRISAYAVSYSATPRGFLSRLTAPELRIRIQQIRNICAGDVLYPQELTYMLLATGDIVYGGNQPPDGLYHYTVERMPELFGTRAPTIDARVGVQVFLSHMRRRALTVVGAIGYHFSLRPRSGTDYTPPVLPPLGLYRSENELILRRVLGDREDILPSLRDFLREYNFGRGPINPRPDLKFTSAFRRYLCMVAVREGFNNDDFEEYVPDPVPPPEGTSSGQGQGNAHDSSTEEADPPAPS